MNAGARADFPVRRILVALDALSENRGALESAAELAQRLHAELVGLFVEDVNLFNLAALPFAKVVSMRTGEEQRLEKGALERELKGVAGQARQAMEVCCRSRQLKWSYRVVRGEVTHELLSAAHEADLLVLGRGSRPLFRRRNLGSTARAAAAQAGGSVLLLEHGLPAGPVAVLYDGTQEGARALGAADALSVETGALTVILLEQGREKPAATLREEAERLLGRRARTCRFETLPACEPGDLLELLHKSRAGSLILPATSDLLSEKKTDGLLERIGIPILLVR